MYESIDGLKLSLPMYVTTSIYLDKVLAIVPIDQRNVV